LEAAKDAIQVWGIRPNSAGWSEPIGLDTDRPGAKSGKEFSRKSAKQDSRFGSLYTFRENNEKWPKISQKHRTASLMLTSSGQKVGQIAQILA
jgi:hypothetical protein